MNWAGLGRAGLGWAGLEVCLGDQLTAAGAATWRRLESFRAFPIIE